MTTSFSDLIALHGRVEIPIIQRDYAQGRRDQTIVRDEFLKGLHTALTTEGGHLDLDFVYGAVINDAFQPLDGQQRLTTLFLLHWYLAWVDGRGEDFRQRFVVNRRSRFGYEVRPTSKYFIDRLAEYDPGVEVAACSKPSELIADQPWFFRGWRFDPTIVSAVNMLDAIHDMFRNTSELYGRLVDDGAGSAVTFQLLDLNNFGLSDDLYIKMNARGKPLTPFETFKARFERDLEGLFGPSKLLYLSGETPVASFFAHQIDTQWSDFFWPHRRAGTATFDDAIMNLIRVVIMVTRSAEAESLTIDLAELRNASRPSGYGWFHERGWLDRDAAVALITLLQSWSGDGESGFHPHVPVTWRFDERALFQEIIARPTRLPFEQLAQFAAYVHFLTAARGEIDASAFVNWMRVVSNLTVNTVFNRPDDLRRSFAGLTNLAPQMHDILSYLARIEDDVVRGFFGPQVAEERIKAHLILLGGGWPERIEQAEKHSYFRGQIGFLLCFCGLDLGDPAGEIARLDEGTAGDLQSRFDHYFACASQMFHDLLTDPNGSGRIWERAALAAGDYLLSDSLNRSLLVIKSDEPLSWKRLLRDAATGSAEGEVLKRVYDQLRGPLTFRDDLHAQSVAQDGLDPWRKAILETPEVYDYGRSRSLRFQPGGGIYPLRKSQMNGRHAELFTFCLWHSLKKKEELSCSLNYEESTSTEEEPSLYLSTEFDQTPVSFVVYFRSGPDRYALQLSNPDEPGADLQALLNSEGFSLSERTWVKAVTRESMKAAIYALDRALRMSAEVGLSHK